MMTDDEKARARWDTKMRALDCCKHPNEAVGEAVQHPNDPLRGYCYGCMTLVQRDTETLPWRKVATDLSFVHELDNASQKVEL